MLPRMLPVYTLALACAPAAVGIASLDRPSSVEVRVHGPVSTAWLLVALCALTGAYCLLRMRSAVEEQRRAAGGEALMGFGMAAMAVPAAVFTPPRWAWPVYAAVFGAAALRALWAARGGPHHLHHLVGSAAMVYMAVAMAAAPPAAHHAHGGPGVPLLTGALLLYFTGYVLLSGARLVPAAGPAAGSAPVRWGDRPELARACRLSMGIGMVAMLLAM
ncbi:putative integral membrane protein [Streptomyces sp. EAS-AB2608]|nr:putative integral membrane protein [Streptomyces sp. EAS-AB2608]